MNLYNTLTRKQDIVSPLEGDTIKLYTCGLTVYSQPHIGNWVAYIYWDVLVRALLSAGYNVNRVQNITDVGHLTSDEDAGEDKMLKGALKEGLTAWQVAEKYIEIANNEAYEQLGLLRPDHMPRATEYIPQQIAFVEELSKKGFTYVIEDGVYFDTAKLPDYGKLARLDIAGLQFGARVADTGKKNPTDFALWKFSDPSEKRDMEWESPWGKGFPGWHLECSVMAREILGEQIDIHTGGIDHIPVHHTNEIAQTESVTGKAFSSIWMHANHIKVDGVKMSKSLGNIYTLKDITDRGFSLDAFKLLVLSKQYRTEGNFTWEILESAQNRLRKYLKVAELRHQLRPQSEFAQATSIERSIADMHGHVVNDLNTPAILETIASEIDEFERFGVVEESADSFNKWLHTIESLLGIQLIGVTPDITPEQKQLIAQRRKARDSQDWDASDTIRRTLEVSGIYIMDTPNGQIWSRQLS